ncbi:S9 family peptidase [Pseudalkalibacillus hwajinpoensis]|uniref:S9 family peptidase n=1 Tax=Guptibacillus hwajinpoensis TaxID=208199 RepID=A0A4U1MKF4_9BACL|nr:S9 family peptidase [Pseudalkalibacillus hwajinpoensis]TKD70890.1 S9 family peptidase [Pseudalkalibacillus hwajinpoensis]
MKVDMSVDQAMIKEELLYDLTFVGDPQLSPDGCYVVYVKKVITEEKEYASNLVLVNRATGIESDFTSGAGKFKDQSPRWSPDGKTLAFVSDRSGKNQIWLISTEGGEARQLTELTNGAVDPVWKPDGSAILVLSKDGEDDENDVRKPLVVNDLHYKADGKGFLDGKHTQIVLVDVTTGTRKVEALTDAPFNHSNPSWSPDGTGIVFGRSRYEEEGSYMRSDLFVQQLEDEGEAELLNEKGGSFLAPKWSPDGKRLSFIGHFFEHEGATLNKVWTVDLASRKFKCLTEAVDLECTDVLISDMHWGGASPGGMWNSEGTGVYFLASAKGNTGIYYAGLDSTVRQISGGDRHHYAFHYVPSVNEASVAVSDPENIGDVSTLSFSDDHVKEQCISTRNAEVLQGYELSIPEMFTYPGKDGVEIQGWLMKPIGFEEDKKYPMILEIHGGPHMMYGNSFMHEFQLLAAKGYVVLYTNPRGSQGYGQEFVNGCRGDYGGGDYEDLMTGVDVALKNYSFIDEERLFVTGGSYGGFMTNWIVGKTERFKAAVTQRSISNWQSFYGVSDIGYFFTKWEVGSDLDENPEKLWHHSPLKYVDQIQTPLLILHSVNDYRCPIEQGEQLYVALKHRGKKTRFVRFPDSDHNLSRSGHPELRVERLKHLAGWFDTHLGE